MEGRGRSYRNRRGSKWRSRGSVDQWSQICINFAEDPDPHLSDKSDPDPHLSEKIDPDPHPKSRREAKTFIYYLQQPYLGMPSI
jgi:hypothetical protein